MLLDILKFVIHQSFYFNYMDISGIKQFKKRGEILEITK